MMCIVNYIGGCGNWPRGSRENPRIDRDEWWMNAVLDLSERRDSLIFSILSGSGTILHEKWDYIA